MAGTNLTTAHRRNNMVVAAEAWQPIPGAGSAQQRKTATTTATSMTIPSNAQAMLITADVNCSLSFMSTLVPTASKGYLLASMTPSPALLLPRWGAHTASTNKVLFRSLTGTGNINFLFLTGRGG